MASEMPFSIGIEGQSITRRDFASVIARAFALSVGVPKIDSMGQPRGNSAAHDSLGRKVRLKKSIARVAPLGVHAQTMLITLMPKYISSLALNLEEDEQIYRDAGLSEVTELPETGALSTPSAKGVAKKRIASTSPDLMIDAGLVRDGLEQELDSIQEASRVPCYFLDISFGKLPEAYRTLGKLLSCEERAEALAQIIERFYRLTAGLSSEAGTICRAFYAPRMNGCSARSGVTVQIDAMRHIGIESVDSPYQSETKSVDVRAVISEDPDLVIFDDTTMMASLTMREGDAYSLWGQVPAVRAGNFVVSPALMHSWFGSMVLVQSIGILWLADAVWPNRRRYRLEDEARAFFEAFYGMTICDNDMTQLLNSCKDEGYAHE